MFEKIIAKKTINRLMTKPDINKAYALTDPSDSWYPTLKKVHDSLVEIRENKHETITITSAEGYTLCAVYYPAAVDAPKGTAVFIHGYTSHAEREWAFPGLFYLNLGYNVVIPYQRAHGKSGGKYITFGAAECDDMERWVSLIAKMHPDLPIVIHGLSMGGGIALQLCDKSLPNVKCIISDAPSDSIKGLFRAIAHSEKPEKEEKQYRYLTEIFFKKTGKDVSVTEVLPHIEHSLYPLYLTAGSEENIGERLSSYAEKCPNTAEVIILPGCNHGNGMYKQTELYHRTLREFLEKHTLK